VGGCGASGVGAGNDAYAALEANLEAVRAESAALSAAKAGAERKVADLEAKLKRERDARLAAEAERDRLRDEVIRLRNELLR
jgi:chromosome segregation ATPase